MNIIISDEYFLIKTMSIRYNAAEKEEISEIRIADSDFCSPQIHGNEGFRFRHEPEILELAALRNNKILRFTVLNFSNKNLLLSKELE